MYLNRLIVITFSVPSGQRSLIRSVSSTMNETELGNVTEPHDFSDERLVVLDTSLRCSICKDLINAPVVAPCSHSFCSMVSIDTTFAVKKNSWTIQCIRESLLVNPACPVCRATVSDGQLKKNTTLSEVIEAYRLARYVFTLCSSPCL